MSLPASLQRCLVFLDGPELARNVLDTLLPARSVQVQLVHLRLVLGQQPIVFVHSPLQVRRVRLGLLCPQLQLRQPGHLALNRLPARCELGRGLVQARSLTGDRPQLVEPYLCGAALLVSLTHYGGCRLKFGDLVHQTAPARGKGDSGVAARPHKARFTVDPIEADLAAHDDSAQETPGESLVAGLAPDAVEDRAGLDSRVSRWVEDGSLLR